MDTPDTAPRPPRDPRAKRRRSRSGAPALVVDGRTRIARRVRAAYAALAARLDRPVDAALRALLFDAAAYLVAIEERVARGEAPDPTLTHALDVALRRLPFRPEPGPAPDPDPLAAARRAGVPV